MQLHKARLCLDCQEIHTAARCPACSSETFAPVSRWIPPQERRSRPRSAEADDVVEGYRRLLAASDEQRTASHWPRRIAFVVAAASVGGWLWGRPRRGADRNDLASGAGTAAPQRGEARVADDAGDHDPRRRPGS